MWLVSLLGYGPSSVTPYGVPPSPWGKATSRRGLPPAGAFPYLPLGEGGRLSGRKRGGTRSVLRPAPHPSRLRRATLSQERVGSHTRPGFAGPPSPRRGFFYAIYASRSESFLTIREVMRNSTATKAKKPHWALVVSEVAMKS